MPGFSRRGRAQVVITEQLRFLGAVQHLYLSNLVFYVCQDWARSYGGFCDGCPIQEAKELPIESTSSDLEQAGS